MAVPPIPPQQQPLPPQFQQQPNQPIPSAVPPQPKKRTNNATAAPTRSSAAYPRKRALTACDTCRLKKIKCDNVRPRCGACSKNGNHNCHYRVDDHTNDYSSFDPASLNILSKLDLILKDIKVLKKNHHSNRDIDDVDDDADYDSDEKSPTRKKLKLSKSKNSNKRLHEFDKCVWDMSLTSIFKWDFFKKHVDSNTIQINKNIKKLIKLYSKNQHASPNQKTFKDRIANCHLVEQLLANNFSFLINSFFLNCHTKVPIFDILELLECIEIYKLMKNTDPKLTFMEYTEGDSYEENVDDSFLPPLFFEALKKNNVEDTTYRRKAYITLCRSIPSILLICALSAISMPVQLDNVGRFVNSKEESQSISISCFSESSLPAGLPADRMAISQYLLNYSNLIHTLFPSTLQECTLNPVQYYVLLNQYHLCAMNPLKAYNSIVKACHSIMYLLQSKRNIQDPTILNVKADSNKKQILDRVFWICLKLESEIRVELSPYVPSSGITQVIPPSPFPKISGIIGDEEFLNHHSQECIKLANKYDDQYSWYYYLTEVAVRKVDNSMFDEIFSHDAVLDKKWDQDYFSEVELWELFVKYLNQYNGIINSLSPKIRNFVLQEVNVEQIYKSIKKRYNKKQLNIKTENDIFDALDDFLVDDDLLLKAQSESIMYIKTRIITSKTVLFRPIIYLILEDKISFKEIIDAAISVLPIISQMKEANQLRSHVTFEDNGPIHSSEHIESSIDDAKDQTDFDYYDLLEAPLLYQKQYPDEDFSNLIEEQGNIKDSIKLKDVELAKNRILRVFFINLITLPKLNIPKLAAHRHPGLWYYLRNLFIGSIYMYLLYKKVQNMIVAASTDESLKLQLGANPNGPNLKQIIETIDMVLSKDNVKTTLEYALIIYNYWKDESQDCVVYHDYIQKCLNEL
ncbi:hypothetical protein HYPBUDRAFT_113352 [Hyphopichia burtonii NRRL Y-1933]|uniref:Zn(2)-C6 fungal-type domain-containing protein n=1 Tax=Hyphopichia burtonii NRRL Y-1933 TaxID=984485 RepID=A0A1E4REK9_9ASCO|nr:hypothetical protein HYPBUDRAFT_113352 [Hyphopichia burtonii NRRL Y-1933]ODV65709.1 hypothetical protein HYPBUDRAFT_113352 [Hyphopichia burtonii NRRL Y-1933]